MIPFAHLNQQQSSSVNQCLLAAAAEQNHSNMTSIPQIVFLCASAILLISPAILEAATPIVMWHGMGDSCCFSFSLGKMKKMLEAEIPGVYVKSLKIGKTMIEDYESGYLVHPNKQIKNACSQIKADPQLQDGFHAVGFSQGGQFL